MDNASESYASESCIKLSVLKFFASEDVLKDRIRVLTFLLAAITFISNSFEHLFYLYFKARKSILQLFR